MALIVGKEVLISTHSAETRLAASESVRRYRLVPKTRRLPEDGRRRRQPTITILIIQPTFTLVNKRSPQQTGREIVIHCE